MRLTDLYPLCAEGIIINIYNSEGDLISRLDGQGSIAGCLKDCQVETIYPQMENTLNVFINTDINQYI